MTLLALLAATACRAPQPGERGEHQDSADTDATTESLPEPDFRDGLTEHGVVTCEDPSLRASEGPFFPAGISKDWTAQLPEGWKEEDLVTMGGLAVADLDGSGRLDIFLPNISPCQLFVWLPDSGGLVDVGADRLPTGAGSCDAWGAVPVDYDGDGDLDLFLLRTGQHNLLWQNDGKARFTDVTAAAGLDATDGDSLAATFGDIDGDGDLDLFVAHYRTLPAKHDIGYGGTNPLYLNNGDGTFSLAELELPLGALDGYTWSATMIDVDADLDLDLYMANDIAATQVGNQLLLGNGTGSFVRAKGTGLEVGSAHMGIGLGDVDHDGAVDYLLSDWGAIALMESHDGAWYDTAAARELTLSHEDDRLVSWGPELQDMDNDGLLDAVMTFGKLTDIAVTKNPVGNPDYQPDAVWLQSPDGTFAQQVADDWGVADDDIGRGFVLADLNRDGFLDWIKRNYIHGPTRIYLSRCDEGAWLLVDLESSSLNTRGIGARVQVEVDGITHTRWVQAGGTTYASGGPPQVHFGLGDHDAIDLLRVLWPDGTTSVYTQVDTRQRLTVAAG